MLTISPEVERRVEEKRGRRGWGLTSHTLCDGSMGEIASSLALETAGWVSSESLKFQGLLLFLVNLVSGVLK